MLEFVHIVFKKDDTLGALKVNERVCRCAGVGESPAVGVTKLPIKLDPAAAGSDVFCLCYDSPTCMVQFLGPRLDLIYTNVARGRDSYFFYTNFRGLSIEKIIWKTKNVY